MGRGFEVWMVESTGGKPRRLDTGPGSSFGPSFSHDGKWVYFSSTRTGREEAFRVPVDGGPAAQLTYAGCFGPLESVDGGTIYCQKDVGRVGATYDLYEVPLGGEPHRPLGISVVPLSFQIVRDGIYFITNPGANSREEEIRFYDFATRRSRLLQALNLGGFGLSVSPDRKRFLFGSLEGGGSDLMLVENFR
jgi:hypothetical protein